jgi:predicted ribosomally synthesized peptide with SipW-like signal peptide
MRKILMSLVTIFAAVAVVAGATRAVFSASANIPGNVVTAGTLTLQANPTGGTNKPIGTTVEKLVPGAWTAEGRAGLYNTGNVSARLYMYVDNVIGGACPKVNLNVDTGPANNPSYVGEHARNVLYENLANITGPGNRREVTGNPPFATLLPNWTQVIWQKAQLDSSASNSYQGLGCSWTEYFVAESL